MFHSSRTLGLLALLLACGLFVRPASGLVVLDTAINPDNGHLYQLLDGSTWVAAEAAAVALGGHLVTINDSAEQNWVWNKWGTTRSLLIGLTDAGHEGTFTWTSGEPFTYSHWAPGEPNNGVGFGTGPENYVYIVRSGLGNSSFWNDFNGQPVLGQSPMFGVVEVVPEPATLTFLALGAFALRTLRRRSS